ncbi:MAG TPA: type II secretion system secretin GspD [Thauera aminoaromatica]|nr:type II secretion system secretin GspD [Thauera aminoaromatica]
MTRLSTLRPLPRSFPARGRAVLRNALRALAIAALGLGSCLVHAAGEPVALNFQNAEIDAVIQAIGRISGRNFLIDPRVKGKINLVTNTPVAPELTYQILLSALRLQGYAAIEESGVTKLVPEADAKLHGVPVVSGRPGAGAARGDRLVTQVFALRHESAVHMVNVVRPLVSANNAVTAFPGNNTLVVTDYAENLRRLATVIDSIDTPQGDVAVLQLQHAMANDLAPVLVRLLAEQQTGGQNAGGLAPPQIVAEPNSNSLLVRADTPSRLAALRQLVTALDRPGAGGDIRVVYLRNADAVQVAATLNAALAGEGGTSDAASTQPLSRNSGGGSGFGTDSSAPSGMGVASAPLRGTGSTAPSAAGGLSSATRGGMVQPDAVNNALIITAPDAIYRNLRAVIDQLDRRRAQVYIEALIAEISTERAAEFGFQWVAGASAGEVGVLGAQLFSNGGGNLGQLIAGSADRTRLTLPNNGLNLVVGGGKVNVPGIGEVLSLGVLARFLENEVSANILSTPNLITLDNEEARIVVGRNLPFVTGQYANTGGGTTPANPFQTIERRDVGLTLHVKPQISEGGAIRLQIYQEASAVVGSAESAAAGNSVTTKRSIESMVLVDDGAILALGGLVEDSYSGGEEKVPVLGDLPFAGSLFRYDTRKRAKTNLVVFLRPVILRDRESYAALTDSRYDYVIGRRDQLPSGANLLRDPPPGEPAPVVDLAFRPLQPAATPAAPR